MVKNNLTLCLSKEKGSDNADSAASRAGLIKRLNIVRLTLFIANRVQAAKILDISNG